MAERPKRFLIESVPCRHGDGEEFVIYITIHLERAIIETYRAPKTSEKKIVFDGAPVIVLKKPKLWPGGEGSKTEVQAGGGPCGYLVVYDPTDTNSVAVANYYQQVRHIPEAKMVPYVFPWTMIYATPGMTAADTWTFINKLKTLVNDRGMTGHFLKQIPIHWLKQILSRKKNTIFQGEIR